MPRHAFWRALVKTTLGAIAALIFAGSVFAEALSPPELKVEPDGRVIRVVRAYGDFTFREDLSEFPFDHQEVHFSVVAGYGPDQVKFIAPAERIGLAEQMSVANWRISAGENRFSDYYIAPLERTLARLDVVFKAERLTGFYTWQLLVPLFLVVMMTWTVFWMPLEFVAPRVGLVATSILVFAALATTVAVTYFEGPGLSVAALRLNTSARWLAPLLFLAAFILVFLL